MTLAGPSRVQGCFALCVLLALGAPLAGCGSNDDSTRSAGSGGQGAGGAPALAGGSPNSAFLERAIPDAQHLEVTETCPGGMRDGKRCIPDRVLARASICYSGYRSNQNPNLLQYPSEDEVKEDLELLLRAGYSFLRVFDATPHAETLLKVITDNQLDVKIQLGIWIKGPKATADVANQQQIEKGIALANQYPNLIVGVSVGNETLDSWSSVLTPAADLTEYIQQVRASVAQPVTTDDLYPPFELVAGYQDVLSVLKAVDYLSVHVYAAIDASFGSWDYQQTSVPEGPARAQALMAAALDYTKQTVINVRKTLVEVNVDVPLLIGEAGWKSRVTDRSKVAEGVYAHEVNQQIFFSALEDWTHGAARDADSPGTAFYFEAFDEPWKTSDDGWGVFDTRRVAKYAMWSKYPELMPPGATPYTSADALFYK